MNRRQSPRRATSSTWPGLRRPRQPYSACRGVYTPGRPRGTVGSAQTRTPSPAVLSPPYSPASPIFRVRAASRATMMRTSVRLSVEKRGLTARKPRFQTAANTWLVQACQGRQCPRARPPGHACRPRHASRFRRHEDARAMKSAGWPPGRAPDRHRFRFLLLPRQSPGRKRGRMPAARACLKLLILGELSWCPGTELNRRPRDFQSRALPTELPGLGDGSPPKGLVSSSSQGLPSRFRRPPRAARLQVAGNRPVRRLLPGPADAACRRGSPPPAPG